MDTCEKGHEMICLIFTFTTQNILQIRKFLWSLTQLRENQFFSIYLFQIKINTFF